MSRDQRHKSSRMPSPLEFKMGPRVRPNMRVEDQEEDEGCDKCVRCNQYDVISDGEYLDTETFLCYTCLGEMGEPEVSDENVDPEPERDQGDYESPSEDGE